MFRRIQIDEAEDQARQAAQRRGEDDRHNAGHVDLDGDVAGLAAVHLAAYHALGVLDRDPALGVGQDDHEHDRHQRQHHQQRQEGVELRFAVLRAAHDVGDRRVNGGPAGHDAGKDQQRKAVANALGVDLVAQPGAELRTGCEGQNDDHGAEDAGKAVGIGQRVHVADDEVVADRKHQADARAHIIGDAAHLALAFLPFFGEVFQVRDRHRQQLHDDGGVDRRLDAQRKDGALAQGSARHHVQVFQHIAGAACEHGGQRVRRDVGHRDRAAQTEQDEDQQGEQEPFTEIVDLPGFPEGFKHLTSPLPSRLLSRFFLWRRQCTQRP